MENGIHMVLRKEQLAHFGQLTRKRFIQKTLKFLRDNFPEWSKDKSEEVLVTYTHDAIAFGEHYGVKRQVNVQKLMALDIGHGLFALEQPEVIAVLEADDLHQDRKIEELFIALNAQNYRKKQLRLS